MVKVWQPGGHKETRDEKLYRLQTNAQRIALPYGAKVNTLSGMVTLVKAVQQSNACSPIILTPLFIFTVVNLSLLLNAHLPILSTLPGMVTLVRLSQS